MSDVILSLYSSKATTIKQTRAFGLLGFIRFTECYYMMLITKIKEVAKIGANSIFEIEETSFKPIFEKSTFGFSFSFSKSDESKYKEIFQGVDLTKNFYFSYNYDLTQTLQMNMSKDQRESSEKYVWNKYLMDCALNSGVNHQYLIPIVHGSISHKSILQYLFKNRNFITWKIRDNYFDWEEI
jgi:phosphatidylinositol 3,5-bisphosphate 5-phosphatase